MQQLSYNIDSSTSTQIYIGASFSNLESIIKDRNYVIISCYNLYNIYPDFFRDKQYILIESKESNKNLKTVSEIIDKLISFEIDRKSLIIGFGGGIVTDITGFVASTYMRGTKFGFIASTLLAQVDAAIGGKNGVNFAKYKNFIGNILQPEFVLCDSNLLLSLSNEDYYSGLGEVIKYALIDKGDLLEYLIQNKHLIQERDILTLNKIVRKCIDIKLEFVINDTNDTGNRHILNFGHSLGHCIEVVDGIAHGLAIVKGIIIAIYLSQEFGYCDSSLLEKTKSLIKSFSYDLDFKLNTEHFEILKNDKKKSGKNITFVFLKSYGNPFIKSVEISEIINALR